MLASMRSGFLLFVLVAFFVVAFLPLGAQVNGVPPSVTSIGFGGRFLNGVPPSVTSIGFGNSSPMFGNCCTNFFWPANPNPPLKSGHHHHRDHGSVAIGVLAPAYIPYADPNDPGMDDDSLDGNPGQSSVPPPPGKRIRDSAPMTDANAEEPVSAQPSTVLIFKDGHQFDVLNYAIVGDTLFDFAADRTKKILLADLDLPATRKANDDRGVDFQIPASTARQ